MHATLFLCVPPARGKRWTHLATQNKTLKGKKVSVPGKKGKHTIGRDVKLTVGAMGIKLMDGECKHAAVA